MYFIWHLYCNKIIHITFFNLILWAMDNSYGLIRARQEQTFYGSTATNKRKNSYGSRQQIMKKCSSSAVCVKKVKRQQLLRLAAIFFSCGCRLFQNSPFFTSKRLPIDPSLADSCRTLIWKHSKIHGFVTPSKQQTI